MAAKPAKSPKIMRLTATPPHNLARHISVGHAAGNRVPMLNPDDNSSYHAYSP